MREELDALARAVRRPMQRWWLRTGYWLLAVCAPLTAIPLYLDTFDWRQRILLGQYDLLHNLLFLVPAIATACWLQAAQRISILRNKLVHGNPQLEGKTLDVVTFMLALRQGALPLAVLAAFGFSYQNSVEPWLLAAGFLSHENALAWCSGVSFFQSAALVMLFIVFLTSMRGIPEWLPWLWFAGLVALDSVESFLAFGNDDSFRMVLDAYYSNLGEVWEQVLLLAGFGAIYFALWSASKVPAQNSLRIATLCGIVFVVASIEPHSGFRLFDQMLAILYALRSATGMLFAGYTLTFGDLSLPWALPALTRTFVSPAAGISISLTINTCWLTLHYFLLRRLLAGSARTSAAAVGTDE